MKKTKYSVMVNSGSVYSINGIWRRVYEQEGRYVVKYNGEIIDVTSAKNNFVAD